MTRRSRQDASLGYRYQVRKERGKWMAVEQRVSNGRRDDPAIRVDVVDSWVKGVLTVEMWRSQRRLSAIIGFRA